MIARLRPGVSVATAQSAMTSFPIAWRKLIRKRTKDGEPSSIACATISWAMSRLPLLILLGAVGFVLLIACANTANLVLARTIARRKELAIRAALGASRSQVLRPVLTETTILAIAGGALGLLVASFGESLVTRALGDLLPRATEVQLDGFVLAFTAVASVLTGLATGLIAGARLMRGDLNDSLKQGLRQVG